MITGVVTSDREPVIPIVLRVANGQVHECDAVIDTGFTGWLTLPPDLISELGLVWRELGEAVLANGSRVYSDVYDATILWDGEEIAISVYEADSEPLVGMRMTYGFELNIRNIDGGPVILRRM
jgi:clan AA aspartic protease